MHWALAQSPSGAPSRFPDRHRCLRSFGHPLYQRARTSTSFPQSGDRRATKTASPSGCSPNRRRKAAEPLTLDMRSKPKTRQGGIRQRGGSADSGSLSITSTPSLATSARRTSFRRRTTRKKEPEFRSLKGIRHQERGRLPSAGDSSMPVRDELRQVAAWALSQFEFTPTVSLRVLVLCEVGAPTGRR